MRAFVDGLRQRLSQDERGMQTVEWVGIGAVAAALTGAIVGLVDPIGQQVVEAVQTLIEQALGGGA